MPVTTWTHWLRSLRHPHQPGRGRVRTPQRLSVVTLEDRTTPATFTVTTTADGGVGSLRQAILDANGTAGLDTIQFNIPGPGVQTIQPTFGLQAVTDAVVIDGYTQPGASANTLAVGSDAVHLVELDGVNIPGGSGQIGIGLDAGSAGSTIRGLVVNRFLTSVQIGSDGNVLEGCYFNTNPAGDAVAVLPNGLLGGGIDVGRGDGNRIGGVTPAARNVIVADSACVSVGGRDFGPTNTRVQGNYLGTNAQGTAPLDKGFIGVDFLAGTNLLIGGLTDIPGTGAGNLISGLRVGDGISFAVLCADTFRGSPEVPSLTIQGNLIGTDATGTVAIAGISTGITLVGQGHRALIGGPQAGARNVISGTGRRAGDAAIVIYAESSFVTVQNNLIGTALDGVASLPNKGDGVFTGSSASTLNVIGGTAPGEGNVIAFNQRDGVVVAPQDNLFTGRTTILGNSIFGNGRLGIDLITRGVSGVTLNDTNDGDGGANGSQNYPVVVGVSGGVISATLNSTPGTLFRVEFFSNLSADPSGFGEGQTYLGFLNVTTDAAGDTGAFEFVSPTPIVGRVISATATDPGGNTSEFSGGRAAPPASPEPTANPDAYRIDADGLLSAPAPGVLGNDTAVGVGPLAAVLVARPAHGSLLLNADGSFTYTPAAGYSGPDGFTYQATEGATQSNVATVSLTVTALPPVLPPVPPPVLPPVPPPEVPPVLPPVVPPILPPVLPPEVPPVLPPVVPPEVPPTLPPVTPPVTPLPARRHTHLRAVGADNAGGPRARAYGTDGAVVFDRFVYEPTFTGGVRVATADVNGDGVDDILTAAGDGGGPRVQVFDGKTGAVLRNFFAFADTNRVGVYLSAADINGDGFADYAVTAGPGGGPRVALFDGKTGDRIGGDFLAFDGASRTGFTVAIGDLNGDGRAEVSVGQAGGGSRIRVFDLTGTMLAESLAYEPTFSGGVNLATGDADGDGRLELLTGAGVGGGPRVRALSLALASAALVEIDNGFSFDSVGRSGVRVGSAINAADQSVTFVGLNGRTRVAQYEIPVAGEDDPFGVDYRGGIWVS